MDDSVLIRAYLAVGVTVDKLPYTEHLGRILAMYTESQGQGVPEQDLWRRLMTLRKKGRLPRLGR